MSISDDVLTVLSAGKVDPSQVMSVSMTLSQWSIMASAAARTADQIRESHPVDATEIARAVEIVGHHTISRAFLDATGSDHVQVTGEMLRAIRDVV